MVNTSSKYTNFLTLKKQIYSVDRHDFFIQSEAESLFIRKVVPFRHVSNHYVLFVHGLTFPSIADFDLPLKGHSVVNFLAERGMNCCLFDFRGYGKSSKSSCVTLNERIADLNHVYQYLVEECQAESISLVGLSSGCNIIVDFIKRYGVQPRDVVLLGPCYLRNDFISRNIEKLQLYKIGQLLCGKWKSPYVRFNRKSLRKRLIRGEKSIIDGGASAMFIEKALDGSETLSSPVLPFFNGCKRADYMAPLFSVDHIECPTLIARGERDEICCKRSGVALYKALQVNGVQTEIYTHEKSRHDMHLYKNCDELFNRLWAFLSQERGGKKHGRY